MRHKPRLFSVKRRPYSDIPPSRSQPAQRIPLPSTPKMTGAPLTAPLREPAQREDVCKHLSGCAAMRSAVASERPVHPRTGAGGGAHWIQVLRSRTKETMGGAGANEESGVLSEASCCRCGAPRIKKKRGQPF